MNTIQAANVMRQSVHLIGVHQLLEEALDCCDRVAELSDSLLEEGTGLVVLLSELEHLGILRDQLRVVLGGDTGQNIRTRHLKKLKKRLSELAA